MIIEIVIQKTQICFRRDGIYTSLVASPTDRAGAEALASQYGFRPDEVAMVAALDWHCRSVVDDRALQEVLLHYPDNPNRSHEELLEIIRRHLEPRAIQVTRDQVASSR